MLLLTPRESIIFELNFFALRKPGGSSKGMSDMLDLSVCREGLINKLLKGDEARRAGDDGKELVKLLLDVNASGGRDEYGNDDEESCGIHFFQAKASVKSIEELLHVSWLLPNSCASARSKLRFIYVLELERCICCKEPCPDKFMISKGHTFSDHRYITSLQGTPFPMKSTGSHLDIGVDLL